MMQFAQHLFVTDFDLGPLMTLAVGLSGRNCGFDEFFLRQPHFVAHQARGL